MAATEKLFNQNGLRVYFDPKITGTLHCVQEGIIETTFTIDLFWGDWEFFRNGIGATESTVLAFNSRGKRHALTVKAPREEARPIMDKLIKVLVKHHKQFI